MWMICEDFAYFFNIVPQLAKKAKLPPAGSAMCLTLERINYTILYQEVIQIQGDLLSDKTRIKVSVPRVPRVPRVPSVPRVDIWR